MGQNIFLRRFLLLILSTFLATQTHVQIPGDRVDNNSTIAGFDDYIWKNGLYTATQMGGAIYNVDKIDLITNTMFKLNEATEMAVQFIIQERLFWKTPHLKIT